jgi:hypothetical protein
MPRTVRGLLRVTAKRPASVGRSVLAATSFRRRCSVLRSAAISAFRRSRSPRLQQQRRRAIGANHDDGCDGVSWRFPSASSASTDLRRCRHVDAVRPDKGLDEPAAACIIHCGLRSVRSN